VNVLPKNIKYGTYLYAHTPDERNMHTKLISYPSNITYTTYIDSDDKKISVNFVEPARKTKFDNINAIRCVTYVGKINIFSCKKFWYAKSNIIAKFYIAHDDLDRFQKLLDIRRISLDDYELLLYAQLMRPEPSRILSHILNDQATKAFAAQFIEYLMCVIELGMPIDVRKIIVNKHAVIFWNEVYDKAAFGSN